MVGNRVIRGIMIFVTVYSKVLFQQHLLLRIITLVIVISATELRCPNWNMIFSMS